MNINEFLAKLNTPEEVLRHCTYPSSGLLHACIKKCTYVYAGVSYKIKLLTV